MFDLLSWILGFAIGLCIASLFFINFAHGEIYNYTTMIGDNISATIYYDEPLCDSAEGYESNYEKCDKLYDELEEEDEEIHKEWAKENYD